MTISITVQEITSAKAKTYGGSFSTVEITTRNNITYDVNLFFHNEGHMDTAARIAALINEDAAREKPKPLPYENSATWPDDEEQDEQLLDEIAQEDRRQAHNDELGPRAPQFPREHEEAMERLVERDDEVPF